MLSSSLLIIANCKQNTTVVESENPKQYFEELSTQVGYFNQFVWQGSMKQKKYKMTHGTMIKYTSPGHNWFQKKNVTFVVFILFVWDYHHDAHVQYADVVVESGESQKLS